MAGRDEISSWARLSVVARLPGKNLSHRVSLHVHENRVIAPYATAYVATHRSLDTRAHDGETPFVCQWN